MTASTWSRSRARLKSIALRASLGATIFMIAGAATSVSIGNGPTVPDGSYVNAAEIADTLTVTSALFTADDTLSIVDPLDLTRSVALGAVLYKLTLAAPIITVGGNVRLSNNVAENVAFALNASILNLNGLIIGGAAATPIVNAAGQFDASISFYHPGQSFVATFAQLGSIGLAYSDLNPGSTNSPIVMTLYEGTGSSAAVVATTTRTLPGVLPGTLDTPQFIDFDFPGVTLVVGNTYSVAVTTTSPKVSVVYGQDSYASGAAFTTGTLSGCTAGCDLNFRVLPSSGVTPIDGSRLSSTATTINVGAGGNVQQALRLGFGPTPVQVNLTDGDHDAEDVQVFANETLTMSGGAIRSVQVVSGAVFNLEGGVVNSAGTLFSFAGGAINIKGSFFQIAAPAADCTTLPGALFRPVSGVVPDTEGCISATLPDGSALLTHFTNAGTLTLLGDGFDSTPPEIAANVSGAQGANGWYTGDVTVSWSVAEPETAVLSSTGCQPSVVDTDTNGLTLTCSATSNGGSASKSVTIKRDSTLPLAVAHASPFPNAAGWNFSPVDVSFSGTDAGSGIATCSAPTTVPTQGSNQSVQGSCTDVAGNVSETVTASGINIDLTPPVASAIATPAANVSGWRRVPVTVTFSAVDDLSGVALNGCPAPVVMADSAPGQSATGFCADRAGNTVAATISGINIDSVPPGEVITVTPAANAAGWNNTNVTVTVIGTEPLNQSGVASCTPPQILSADGSVIASGSCIDVAGNIGPTATLSVNIDKTPPTATISTPNSGNYAQGAVVNAAYSCADDRSGFTQCSGTVANGAPIDTASAGTKTFTVSVMDAAGNVASVSRSYTVTAATATTPVITPVLTGTAGTNGWYTSNVGLTWTVQSSTALLSSNGCAARSVTNNTAGITYTCTARNASGTSTRSVTIKRDATPPNAQGTARPQANANGWRNSAITVTFTANDNTSGIASCTAPVVLTAPGTSLSASGSCTNNAGLQSGVTINGIRIDLSPPVVTISSPANGAIFARNAVVRAGYACSDGLSGIAVCNSNTANGARIDTSRARTNATLSVTGRDRAGNATAQTVTYSVR